MRGVTCSRQRHSRCTQVAFGVGGDIGAVDVTAVGAAAAVVSQMAAPRSAPTELLR